MHSEPESQYNALIRQAITELESFPHIDKKQMIKTRIRNIKNKISGQFAVIVDRYSWPNALLANALLQVYHVSENEECLLAVKKYCEKWIDGGSKLYYIDNLSNGNVLLDLYERYHDRRYMETADKLIQYAVDAGKDKAGSIIYRQGGSTDIYIDMLGMVCPFLCRYAALFKREELRTLAVSQIRNFINHGMEQSSFLPYHGYNNETGIKKGIVGWGRAVGWLLIGIADSLEYIPRGTKDDEYLSNVFSQLISNTLSYQRKTGYFGWQIMLSEGEADTSATGMILYAVQKGIDMGVLDASYESSVDLGTGALLKSFHEGKIMNCSAECGGFGIYPQRYGSYPWSVGPALSLLMLRKRRDK